MENHDDKGVHRAAENHEQTTPYLLPLKMAARILGLTVWAMRERIWAGQIPVVQFQGGRKQYVDVRDLEDFIATNKRVVK
jgi:hypothetical protein